MEKVKYVKKSISIPEKTCKFAEKEAAKYYGSNFSIYVSYLIAKEMEKKEQKGE